jgi:hypothetical protein
LVANVKEKTMADIRICKECGRRFDNSLTGGADHGMKSSGSYCSAKCERDAMAAKGGSSRSNAGGMKLGIAIILIIVIIGGIGVAVDSIKNAFSDTKIKIVSASCETEEKFVSILKEALSVQDKIKSDT